MQEEILIKSNLSQKWKKIFFSIIFSCLALALVFVAISPFIVKSQYNFELNLIEMEHYNYFSEKYECYHDYYYSDITYEFSTFEAFMKHYIEDSSFDRGYLQSFGSYYKNKAYCSYPIIINWGLIALSLTVLVYYLILKKCKLTITEKNIVGTSVFGRKVTLPLYMVSAFSTRKFLSVISISSASGRTKFYFIENSQEIGEVLQNSINERQANTQTAQQTIPTPQQAPTNNLDELKKLKELLDAGIITQEEFEQKKKQMLGL